MTGGTTRVIALVLCLAAAPAADSQVVESVVVRSATEIARSLDLIAAAPARDAVARERQLDDGLHDMARLAPTPEARATVRRLATRKPTVYARIDPDHGDRLTPLYDVGATARFVLHAWERNGAREQALTELRAGWRAAIDRYAARANTAARDPVRMGIADAFRAATVGQLALQRAAIVSAIGAGQRVDELALVLAERLADAELFELVTGHADAPVALAGVRAITRTFDSRTALELLTIASRRAEIGSAAVLAIGGLASNDGSARAALFDLLEDADLGASAAAALAALGDPSVTAELGRRLQASRSESSRRTFVLALKLDANAGAREELRRFAATRKGSAELQREVGQWLAR